MSGLFGFQAPAITDFTGAAEATAAGNISANNLATKANRPNQVTPWGSTNWTQDANGNWTQNVSLNPNQQSTLNAQQGTDATLAGAANGMAGGVANGFSQPFNTSGMTGLFSLGNPTSFNSPNYSGTSADPTWKSTEQIQNAMLGRLTPQMKNARDSEVARLKAMGITEGSEAWNNSMDQIGRNENDMQMQALLAGSSAANQQFQNTLSRDTFNNTAQAQTFSDLLRGNSQNWGQQIDKANTTASQRQQQLAEGLTLRDLPYQELMKLRGQNVTTPDMPSFVTAGATTGPNYLGAAELNQRQNVTQANAANANKSNTLNGLFDLAKYGWDMYSNW